jgi:hypothetical protein
MQCPWVNAEESSDAHYALRVEYVRVYVDSSFLERLNCPVGLPFPFNFLESAVGAYVEAHFVLCAIARASDVLVQREELVKRCFGVRSVVDIA